MAVALKSMSTIAAIGMGLSPIGDVLSMKQNGSPGERSYVPYLSMMASSLLWTMYAWQTSNILPLGLTNLVLEILSGGYFIIFLLVSQSRKRWNAILASSIVFLTIQATYFYVTSDVPELIEPRLGLIGCFVTCLMFLSPLVTIKNVLETRSSGSISKSLAWGSFVNSVLWSWYGILENNLFVIIPNVIGTVSSVLQLLLIWYFPPRSLIPTQQKLSAKILPRV